MWITFLSFCYLATASIAFWTRPWLQTSLFTRLHSSAKSFQVAKARRSPNVHIVKPTSLAELTNWARDNYVKYDVSDLEFTVSDGTFNFTLTDFNWDDLVSSQVYNLSIKPLAQPFKTFTTLESIKQHAGLVEGFSTDLNFRNNLPSPPHQELFAKSCLAVVDRLSDNDILSIHEGKSECEIRDFISPLLKFTAKMVNAECNGLAVSASGISEQKGRTGLCKHAVALEYETPMSGTFAYGSLDFALYIHYFILIVAEAKKLSVCGGQYQLLAQIVVMRQRISRVFRAAHPNIDPEMLEAVLDRYPSFGVVSTGRVWRLVRYEKVGSAWTASWSEEMRLIVGGKLNTEELAAQRVEVEGLMCALYGMLKAQMLWAAEIEDEIQKMSSAADKL